MFVDIDEATAKLLGVKISTLSTFWAKKFSSGFFGVIFAYGSNLQPISAPSVVSKLWHFHEKWDGFAFKKPLSLRFWEKAISPQASNVLFSAIDLSIPHRQDIFRISWFSFREFKEFLGFSLPFLLENELKAKEANYSKADDWHPYAITDGNLITGQNPASSDPVAKVVLEKIKQ